MSDLLRIAYLSSNALDATDEGIVAEINAILAVAQHRNRLADVTGALIFNRGVFGQILEGPRRAVESTFARIERDSRHHSIRVLEKKPVETLAFRNWFMGFAGSERALNRAFHRGFPTGQPFDITRLSGDEMFQVLTRMAVERELSITADGVGDAMGKAV